MKARIKSSLLPICFLLLAALLSGCDRAIDSFEPNRILARRLEMSESVPMERAAEDAQELMEEVFGTPDVPKWPEFLAEGGAEPGLISTDNLTRAAGPFSSDEDGSHIGVYREHCVVCHGIAGDGLGPSAALLNPYPRDFRLGKYKFKSTPIGKKPTREDLRKTLTRGIPGTSMPSFAQLSEEDLEALVDYVIYLSVRGEIERQLLNAAALDLDLEKGERLYDSALKKSDVTEYREQMGDIERRVERLVGMWESAGESTIEVPEPPEGFPMYGSAESDPEQLKASIAHGQEIFRGTVVSCAFCHGLDAEGDGQQNNYDDWTRDWTQGLDPRNESELEPLLEIGALKPRNILPRNLRLGVFRGGSSPEEIYTRIAHGIEGTPMPAAPLQPDNPLGIQREEVWDIVNYLLSLEAEPNS